MAAPVIYSSTSDDVPGRGSLFQGTKFWLSQKVPQRTRFISDISANGGEIVPLEKHAHVKIVDHARKELIPNSHSYTYIEQSIRNGALEKLEDHVAGPSQTMARNIGSVARPPKATKQKFTHEDDRILWDWVNSNLQQNGGTDGNEIYKQLEKNHSHHPWQSWRHRYIKQLKGKPRPIYPPNNAPPTPPADLHTSRDYMQAQQRRDDKPEDLDDDFDSFSEDEEQELLGWGDSITQVDPDQVDAAWQKWANTRSSQQSHPPERWRSLWETKLFPRYQKQKEKRARKAALNSPDPLLLKASPVISTKKPPIGAKIALSKPNLDVKRRTQAVREDVVRSNEPEASSRRENEEVTSPIGNSFLKKRKRDATEDEPLSSPPIGSAKSVQQPFNAREQGRAIASTPEGTPIRRRRPASPLFVEAEAETRSDQESTIEFGEKDVVRLEKAPSESGEKDVAELGRVPSESLSEPGQTILAEPGAEEEEDSIDIDFDVPPPTEGWNIEYATAVVVPPPRPLPAEEDLQSISNYDSAREQLTPPKASAAALDTQAFFDVDTQDLDLIVPEPEDGWANLLPSSSPPPATRPANGTDTAPSIEDPSPLQSPLPPPTPSSPPNNPPSEISDIDAKLDAWIAARAAAEGCSEQTVETVLHRTNMDTELAARTLRHMRVERASLALGRRPASARAEAQELDFLPQDWKGVWTDEDDADRVSGDARRVQRLMRKHGDVGFDARWSFLVEMGAEETA